MGKKIAQKTEAIQKELARKTDACFTWFTLIVLILESAPLACGVIWQFCSNRPFINQLTKLFAPTTIIDNSSIIISTETAYMGAAIAGTVFFFSIMDSGRIGIPYRKIMNYKYGTLSVSFSIVLSVISLFISIIGFLAKKYYIWCGAGATMVLLQSSVLWRVLLSTSYRVNVKTITKQEEEQLIFLTEKRNELEQLKIRYELRIDSFMGRVASSNAVTTDKTMALRELLDVPYGVYKDKKAMNMEALFQVYYNNFRDIFVRIEPNEEQTETVYGLFYEMVSDKGKNIKKVVFWPMVTAAWYAAFVCKPIRYDGFWVACINQMPDEYQKDALSVFILMCGFWDRYEYANLSSSVEELCGSISCSKSWQYNKDIESLFTILWNCWLKSIGINAGIHTNAELTAFVCFEEVLSEMQNTTTCTDHTVCAFIEWFSKRRNQNDIQKHTAEE